MGSLKIETDHTVMFCHLRFYCISYCLILVLVCHIWGTMSTCSITYLSITHSTEVSKPIFPLTATITLVNRTCFISLPLLHYHDHPTGSPHSAHTYCSVEFLFNHISHLVVPACRFCLVIPCSIITQKV